MVYNLQQILASVYIVSIVILVTAVFVILKFVIPLQIREAMVKNGLAQLRKQMLLLYVLVLTVCTISGFTLLLRLFISNDLTRIMIAFLVLVFSFSFLGIAYIGYKIYHQQYTREHKLLHEQIAKLQKVKEVTD